MAFETTTLVCLFHHHDRAQAALEEILQAGLPESAVTMIGGDGAGVDALDKSDLADLDMPDRDYDHLKQGIAQGGTVLSVQSISEKIDTVEGIFKKHSASKIDEADTNGGGSFGSTPLPVNSAPISALSGAAATPALLDEDSVDEDDDLEGDVVVLTPVRVYRQVDIVDGILPAEAQTDDLDRLPGASTRNTPRL